MVLILVVDCCRTSANGTTRETSRTLHQDTIPTYKSTFKNFSQTTLRFPCLIYRSLEDYTFMALQTKPNLTGPILSALQVLISLLTTEPLPDQSTLQNGLYQWLYTLATTPHLSNDSQTDPICWYLKSLAVDLESPSYLPGTTPIAQLQPPGKLSNPYAHVQHSVRLLVWYKAVTLLNTRQDLLLKDLHP